MNRGWHLIAVTGLMVVFLLGSAVPSLALVDARGSDETHDIATWNWQDFPKEGVMTVNYLTLLINDLEMDLFVLQEIDSIDDYEQLISNLADWDGIYSPDTYGGFYVKTGILYNTDKVEIGDMVQLFADEDITRPPIMVPVTMFENGDTLSFNLIALHLKAGGGAEDLDQRRLACQLLKDYVEDEINSGGETRWMIAGDFNDTLDDPPDYNAFTVFLDDPDNWTFLTSWMAGIDYWASHIASGRLIDHFLVTADMLEEYGDGSTMTMRLDAEWGDYETYISDHRPVGSYFPGAVNDVAESSVSALPEDAGLSVWPVPSNASITVSYDLPGTTPGTLEVLDLLGRCVDLLELSAGNGEVSWSPGSHASGIFFVRLNTGGVSVIRKAVFIR